LRAAGAAYPRWTVCAGRAGRRRDWPTSRTSRVLSVGHGQEPEREDGQDDSDEGLDLTWETAGAVEGCSPLPLDLHSFSGAFSNHFRACAPKVPFVGTPILTQCVPFGALSPGPFRRDDGQRHGPVPWAHWCPLAVDGDGPLCPSGAARCHWQSESTGAGKMCRNFRVPVSDSEVDSLRWVGSAARDSGAVPVRVSEWHSPCF
jgi:hypothetical protein